MFHERLVLFTYLIGYNIPTVNITEIHMALLTDTALREKFTYYLHLKYDEKLNNYEKSKVCILNVSCIHALTIIHAMCIYVTLQNVPYI